MKKVHLLQTMMLMCLILLCGCMRPREIYYAEPGGKISVEGDKIYQNNELYAELRYRSSMDGQRHTGLAMYYHPYDKEEWIFPKCGWAYYVVEEKKKYSTIAEMDKLKRTAKERGYTLGTSDRLDEQKVFLMIGDKKFEPVEKSPTATAFDIQITGDGKYVYYEVKNGRDGIRKYRVRYEDCFTMNR